MHGLRLLAFLRLFAPTAQALTLLVVTQQYGVHAPPAPVYILLVIEALLAAATWIRVSRTPHVSAGELFAQVHLDILLLTAMLYFTGGASNPFAPLYLLPMSIVASALRARWVWITALSTMVAYAFLRLHHVPLYHPNGETEVYQLHEDGMVVNYLFTAALLAFFVNRMRVTFLHHQRLLADARDAQMRSESVVAIGSLAAGYAHELGSPLATVAVVVSELKCQHRDNARLVLDLQLIEDQIRSCKQVISSMVDAGGRRRAESVVGAKLDHFVQSIVEAARALHPDATIMLTLDRLKPPPRIVAEETLRQAITNLVTNAAQASPLHVEVRADWSGAELMIEVRDRGPGFAADMLSRLGKQVGTTKGPAGGMGLGLMLSAATLERLGGRLELSNDPEGGARAAIHVPLSTILIEPNED